MVYFALQLKFLQRFYTQDIAVLINANIHHIIATPAMIYSLVKLCDYPFAFLSVEKDCVMNYLPFYSYWGTFSIGYFTYDMILALFVV